MKYNTTPLVTIKTLIVRQLPYRDIGPLTTVEYGLFGNQDFNSNHG